MPARQTNAAGLIAEIRGAFHDLAAYGADLYRDLSVNASMRAVMEFIDARGPQTVPAMARDKNVSRQHIQTIVDLLHDAQLVEQMENPAHKRSVLIALTRKGRALYEKIHARDKAALKTLTKDLAGVDLAAACDAITALREAISQSQTKGERK